MKYRSDIDGLRAVAVASVVLYHADLFGVSGGFVGVDVFFVISGYLITQILKDEVAAKRFSLLRFYDRRVRRLLPAYVVVAVVTTLAALATLPPDEFATYGRRLASTAVFASNFLFRLDSGYFARAATDNPLLHTWSLSVEEQFYLAWPLFLAMLLNARLDRWRRVVLGAGFASSLALAIFAVYSRPPAAFFYSPLRAWELLLGAMVAMECVPRFGPKAREVAAALGAALVAAPAFLYSDATVFPGMAAVPPCMGAALIIAAGRDGNSFVGRALSIKPVVFTGLISYSLYLWHWPAFVFARLFLGHDLDATEAIVASAGSYALAAASWFYVERRFRGHAREERRVPRSIPVGVGALAALFAVGVVIDAKEGWPARSNPRAVEAQAQIDELARGPSGCVLDVSFGTTPPERGCLLGLGGDEDVRAVLVGDSHAAAYAPAVDRIARERAFTVRQWTKSSCSPALLFPESMARRLLQHDRGEESCRRFMQTALERLVADERVTVVILAGFWSSYSDDKEASAARWPVGIDDHGRLRAGLEEFVSALADAGKSVVLLGQVPVFPNGGGDCILRQRFMRRDETTACAVPARYEEALLSPSDRILGEIAQQHAGVHFFRGSREFCADGTCLPVFDGGRVAFRDEHHLTLAGSLHVARRMHETFRQAGL